ncbi:MAG: amidohydrolase [Planctomycetota bacterium]
MATALLLPLLLAVPQGAAASEAEPLTAAPAAPDDLGQWIDARLDGWLELYRELHRSPELSYFEEATAARFADSLRAAGATVTTSVGGHGVVGIVENGTGPTLMLRADLDGLPIEEQTGLPYASTAHAKLPDGSEVSVMHACGHDIHMTNLLATVHYLTEHRDEWRGRLMCIGQPAEERGGGALAMLRAGLFRRFHKPDFALALHVHPAMAAGTVGQTAGYNMANVDSVDITVFGRGGHGAYPHKANDPIVQAAQLVMELQTIVSREVDPREPAVVTVGSIHGGAKHNIIPDRCHLQLTIRSYAPEVRELLLAAIRRKAEATAKSFGAPPPDVRFSEHVPALRNDPALVEQVAAAFRAALGAERVLPAEPVMGAEDFAYYGQEGVPLFMFRLGTVPPETLRRAEADGTPLPAIHSPFYAPAARDSLHTGITAMVTGAMALLPK